MFSHEDASLFDGWYDQPSCEFCGRSIIVRFPTNDANVECDACADDFNRLNEAGKLEVP